MNQRFQAITWILLTLGLLSGVWVGCSNGKAKNTAPGANAANPSKIETARDQNLVELNNPEQFPVVKVETRPLADQVHANGAVAWDVTRAVPVNSIAGGRVLDIKARLGDDVRKGQVLLVIDSPDLAAALADFRKASSTERLAQKAYDRVKALYEHKAAPLKDVQQSEEDLQKATVDKETAAERIRIIGSQPDQSSPIIHVKAPTSGAIVEQNTTRGAAVKSLDNSPNLFTIADLSHVWVVCDLYENNLTSVKVGDYAEVKLNAFPDRTWRARIGHISRVLDPATRTAKVRLELSNSEGLLRPGMFAVARFVSRVEKSCLVVPTSAILVLHDKNWVFRAEGNNRFRRTEVQTGQSLDSRLQEIKSGLQPGDQIVENALQFSSAASSREGT